MINIEEYKICQKRGHVSSGTATSTGYSTTYTCKFCGINYGIEPSHIIEHFVPGLIEDKSEIEENK